MRLAALALGLSLLTGCTRQEIVEVSLDSLEFELGFALIYDDQNQVTQISPPFGIRDGAVETGGLPFFDLDAEEEVLIVGFDLADIRAQARALDDTRLSEMTLLVDPTESLPSFDQEDQRLMVAVPEAAASKRGTLDGPLVDSPTPEGLALSVPVAPEACSIPRPVLSPFCERIDPIDDDPINFAQTTMLSEDLVVALTEWDLYLLQRDVGVIDRLDLRRRQAPHHVRFTRMVHDRDRDRVWVVGGQEDENLEGRGLLVEVDVSTGISLVSTTTTSLPSFSAVAVDDQGPVLVSFDLSVRRFTSGSFVDLPPLTGPILGSGVRVARTLDPAFPLVAATEGHLMSFDAADESWVVQEVKNESRIVPLRGEFQANGFAFDLVDGVQRSFAVGSLGLFQRIGSEPWSRLRPTLPPRLSPCLGGEYPELEQTAPHDDLFIEGDDLFVTRRECTAILQLSIDGTCGAVISVGGTQPAFTSQDLQAMSRFGPTLVVGAEEGLIYSARLD